MSNKRTKEQARERFLQMVRGVAMTWAAYDIIEERERCEGVVATVLSIFDGSTGDLGALNIVARPHPDDKNYHITQGENYIPDGLVINDDSLLHELFLNPSRAESAAPLDSEPRALTRNEVRVLILDTARDYAHYWAQVRGRTIAERCDGLCFSLMNIFDGTTGSLPAFDIVADGLTFNDDCELHDLYYER